MNIDEVGVNTLLIAPLPTVKDNSPSVWNVIVALFPPTPISLESQSEL